MNLLNFCQRWLCSSVLGGLIAFAVVEYQTVATAATTEPAKARAPAAVSGELVVYTAWDERDINALIAGFNRVYPNVKVSGVRSEGGRAQSP